MTSVRVTGQTFDHRDTLKKYGGRWDASARNWVFDYVTPRDLATLKGLSGCLVTGDTPPQPIETENDFDWLELLKEKAESKPPVIADRKSAIYGDDETYFNYFHDKNPKAFFGFSSLGEMTKFVEAIPQHKREDERNAGWRTGDAKWSGSANMQAAIRLARDGWEDGLTKSAQILELLNLENAVQRKRAYSVAGGPC